MEVCPNCVKLEEETEKVVDRKQVLSELGFLPRKRVFVYGGN